MIQKRKKIRSVLFEHISASLANISSVVEDDTGTRELPFQFPFLGSWIIKFECPQCGEINSFGHRYDKTTPPFHFNDFKMTRHLCEKYYHSDVLTELEQLFGRLELVVFSGKKYLVTKGTFDEVFPIVSSSKLIYGCCSKCSLNYIALVNIFHPQESEKNNPSGKVGLVAVDEILYVNFPNDLNVDNYFKLSMQND